MEMRRTNIKFLTFVVSDSKDTCVKNVAVLALVISTFAKFNYYEQRRY